MKLQRKLFKIIFEGLIKVPFYGVMCNNTH